MPSAKLTESQLEELRNLTVKVLLEMRSAYLAAGANPLKHWEQLQTRAEVAVRTSPSVEEWVSKMQRKLGLSGPSKSISSAATILSDEVAAMKATTRWLDMVESEAGYLFALAQVEAEDRRERKETGHGTEAS